MVEFEQDNIEMTASEETTENGWLINVPYFPMVS